MKVGYSPSALLCMRQTYADGGAGGKADPNERGLKFLLKAKKAAVSVYPHGNESGQLEALQPVRAQALDDRFTKTTTCYPWHLISCDQTRQAMSTSSSCPLKFLDSILGSVIFQVHFLALVKKFCTHFIPTTATFD